MARLKHIDAFCSYCNKMVKLEIVGEISILESDNRKWARCKTCKHTMMMDIEGNVKLSENNDRLNAKSKDCKVYSPFDSYEIGDSIYHTSWDDRGKVIIKETTSNGAKAIIVEFEKLGQKKLIEELKNN